MKKKIIVIFIICQLCLLLVFCSFANNSTDSLPGKSGKIQIALNGIKEEQSNKAVGETNLFFAQTEMDSLKPNLVTQRDTKKQEAANLKAAYDDKYVIGTPEFNHYDGLIKAAVAVANEAQHQIDKLQADVDKAQEEIKLAEERLKEWQQELLSIQNMNGADWDCFFDNKCGTYGPEPDKGKGFVIVPNTGAPGIFTPLSEEYKDRYKIDNKSIPLPPSPPPQKGMVEEASEKVKGYFSDVIQKSKNIKKRVMAVFAVRG
ncbi:MAG: hypothetical protein ABI685_08695 [Ferruginibacter sp.]